MQIDGVQVAILYYGSGELPAAVLKYLFSRLRSLAVSLSGPFNQSFKVQFDDRLLDCRLKLDKINGHKIEVVDRTCTDYSGFLLWRKNVDGEMTYWASFLDGTKEQIKPLDEQTGDEVLAGWEVPPHLQSPNPPIASSLFSGQMREVVQCYHLTREYVPFQHTHGITHGIFENPARVPGDPKVGDFFLIEISNRGVFAYGMVNTGRCCDSWDVGPLLADESEPPAYAQTVSLAWNALDRAPQNRPEIFTLMSETAVATAFSKGAPFVRMYGWAFSRSGHEAQQVVEIDTFSGFDTGSATMNFHSCSRGKFTFTVNDQNEPQASFAWVEKDRQATFARPNGIMWVPRWGSIGTYDGVYPHQNSINNQDAPVYVFYIGDKECVLRWQYNWMDVPLLEVGPTPSAITGDVFSIFDHGDGVACPGCQGYSNITAIPGTWTKIDAYTLTRYGFYLTGPNPYNGVGDNQSSHNERKTSTTLTWWREEASEPYLNGTGQVGTCSPCGGPCSNIIMQRDRAEYSYTQTNAFQELGVVQAHGSCVVIPHYEREGVLCFQNDLRTVGVTFINGFSSGYRTFNAIYFVSIVSCNDALGGCCNNTGAEAHTLQLQLLPPPPGSVYGYSSVDTYVATFSGEFRIRAAKGAQGLPVSGPAPAGEYAQVMRWVKGSQEFIHIPTYIVGAGLFYARTEEEDGVEDPVPEERFVGYALAIEKDEFDFDGQLLSFVGRI